MDKNLRQAKQIIEDLNATITSDKAVHITAGFVVSILTAVEHVLLYLEKREKRG